jgi:hypothetical protein
LDATSKESQSCRDSFAPKGQEKVENSETTREKQAGNKRETSADERNKEGTDVI